MVVTGENIVLAGASIDASGQAGGGHVLIGGDTGGGNPSALAVSIAGAGLESFAVPTATTVSVDTASVINASAIGQGNGGKVVVWSEQDTTFAGSPVGAEGSLRPSRVEHIAVTNGTAECDIPAGSAALLCWE